VPYVIKNCLNCHQDFNADLREVKRQNAKFCSRRCSRIHYNNNRTPLLPNVTCAHCNIMFYKNISKQKKSKSGLYFCSRAHKDASQKIGGIKEIMPPHYGNGVGLHDYRRIAFLTKPKRCERCSYDINPAAIIVHHKDRNRENYDITNLEVLCANCHFIEHYGEINFNLSGD